jgi:outer membrane biosynthesis protein TonB
VKPLIFLVLAVFLSQEETKPKELCVIHVESVHYPPLARQVAAQGAVSVAAIVDRQGKVISAEATTGHPLLKEVSVANLRKWKFQSNSAGDTQIEVIYSFWLGGYCPLFGGRRFI